MIERILFTLFLLNIVFFNSCHKDEPCVTCPSQQDTTSHNFVWRVDTLGVGSSIFNDVAIINDTLIFAVGELRLKDSSGQVDASRYNLAIWSGNSWEPRRLNYAGYPPVIRTIFAVGGQTNNWEILAIASSSQTTENALLQIQSNNSVTMLNTAGLSPFSTGIWFAPGEHYYIVGSGIHQKSQLADATWKVYGPGEVTTYASSAIYGQAANDIFVVGSFHEVAHFNGSTWYNYKKEIPFANGVFASVHAKGNIVAIVGFVDQKAVAIIGRR